MEPDSFVWVVRENYDKTEGRGPMVDIGVYSSEAEAFEANRSVFGVMGVPREFGGEIFRITLGSYPLEETKVFGYRKDWTEKWGYGWLDLRDRPNENDPEWIEYLRLRKRFDPTASLNR
jgi:hypothetical protein